VGALLLDSPFVDGAVPASTQNSGVMEYGASLYVCFMYTATAEKYGCPAHCKGQECRQKPELDQSPILIGAGVAPGKLHPVKVFAFTGVWEEGDV